MNNKTYIFKAVIEEDPYPDGRTAYHAYCPQLLREGASTWGYTYEEALKNIQEVVQMIIEGLIEDGDPVPKADVATLEEPVILI